MNFSEAFKLGRETNHAITRDKWGMLDGKAILYVFHGMDNIISMADMRRDDDSYERYVMCAADAWADDWKVVEEQPYNGPLQRSWDTQKAQEKIQNSMLTNQIESV